MRLDKFTFTLPEELIAQYPAPQRDAARLMVLERATAQISTGFIPDIAACFRPGDLLVMNDTRVRPARLLGHKESGGQIEAFLLQRHPGERELWSCLTRASKSPRTGCRLFFPGTICGTVQGLDAQGLVLIEFASDGDFIATLEQFGHVPLPPYIRRADEALDRERYQTIYAATPGAVAAPTAGLHFTPALFERLRAQGVEIATLTLHVGIGTFTPVRVENLSEHRMHSEAYHIPVETAAAVNRAKAEGRRVIAVGTTTTRTLEAVAARQQGGVTAGAGETDIFITPGAKFRVIDGLITNFHLPESTLLVLVSAFAGHDLTMSAYRQAVAERFRFFSYGDCMLIL
jgi:S-adenosylmethionine:tRNA ribosyltransferase-isomerase